MRRRIVRSVTISFLLCGVLSAAGCQKGSSPADRARQAQGAAEKGSGMSESKNTSTVTFEVHGMHCEGCVGAIQRALGETQGVVEKTVSLAESAAVVTYDPAKVAPADLVAVIEELGYTAVEKH